MTSDTDGVHRFKAERLLRLAQIERWHFWFVGRRTLVDRLLKKYLIGRSSLVLDLGCGTGLTLEMLGHLGHRPVGLDLRPEGLVAIQQQRLQSLLVQADAHHLPLRDNLLDAVTLLDVLEHTCDQIVLREVKRVLKPGGFAVISVPAFPWLWSYRDRDAGHLRRYTRRQLLRTISESQLVAREIHYYQFLLFPLVLLSRLCGRGGPSLRDIEERPLPALNSIMTWINKREAQLCERFPWRWGSSLVVICQKT